MIFKKLYEIILTGKAEKIANLLDSIKGCVQKLLCLFDFYISDILLHTDAINAFKDFTDIIFVITEMLGNTLDGQRLGDIQTYILLDFDRKRGWRGDITACAKAYLLKKKSAYKVVAFR